MLTIFPDYAANTASRSAHKAQKLTDPVTQLPAYLPEARSMDADVHLLVAFDQLGKLKPYLSDMVERGAKIRYVVTTDSPSPLQHAWAAAVAGYDTIEIERLDNADKVKYEEQERQKPLAKDASYAEVRQRAHDRPGAEPVLTVLDDPTDPANWED